MLQSVHGSLVIAKHEFVSNFRSIRTIIIILVFALTMIGGTYGLATVSIDPEAYDIGKLQDVLSKEPDKILYLTSTLVSFVGSIMAITWSYDSIVRDRVLGRFEYLLSKPVTKMSVVVGKFLGLIAGVGIPAVVILILSIVVLFFAVGDFPSISMSIGYIGLTLMFLSGFILIVLIFSTLSKSIGTALQASVGIWLLMTLFWTLIPLSLGASLGMNIDPSMGDTTAFNALRSKIDLFNPIGAYDLSLGVLCGGANIAPACIPEWAPVVAMCLWVIAPLAMLILLFERIE